MKLQLQFEQKESPFGYKETRLVRIKLMDDKGKYIKFIKHTEAIVDFIENVQLDAPDDLSLN